MSFWSQRMRRREGFMFKLGQNTTKRLPRGIFVSLLFAAVAMISSVTVNNKSRFSGGSRVIKAVRASRPAGETVRILEKFGIARVEREGGLRNEIPFFGPDGSVGPFEPMPGLGADPFLELAASASVFSAVMIASKRGARAEVNKDSGTTSDVSGNKQEIERDAYIHVDTP